MGKADTEEVLLLTAFGVSASEYLTLQKFLPTAHFDLGAENRGIAVEWNTREWGHPANWTAGNIEFCLTTFLDVALKIQHAPPVPMAAHFLWVYDDVITPKAGPVDLWRYEYEGGATLLTAAPRKGAAVYTLQPGQQLRCRLARSPWDPPRLRELAGRQRIEDATILEVRTDKLPGVVAYVEAGLVDISFVPKRG